MADDGRDPGDTMRRWFERQAGAFALDGASSAAWDRAEALYREWTAFAGLTGAGSAATRPAGLFDPRRWVATENDASMTVLQGILSTSALGVPPTGDGADSWQRYNAALESYRAITGAAWLGAFSTFAERAKRDTDDARRHGQEPPDLDALLGLWREIADHEFAETQCSAEFLETQTALLRAGLQCRRAARDRIEAVAGAIGLPTRSEIDDLTETVHALRIEVDRLRDGR